MGLSHGGSLQLALRLTPWAHREYALAPQGSQQDVLHVSLPTSCTLPMATFRLKPGHPCCPSLTCEHALTGFLRLMLSECPGKVPDRTRRPGTLASSKERLAWPSTLLPSQAQGHFGSSGPGSVLAVRSHERNVNIPDVLHTPPLSSALQGGCHGGPPAQGASNRSRPARHSPGQILLKSGVCLVR